MKNLKKWREKMTGLEIGLLIFSSLATLTICCMCCCRDDKKVAEQKNLHVIFDIEGEAVLTNDRKAFKKMLKNEIEYARERELEHARNEEIKLQNTANYIIKLDNAVQSQLANLKVDLIGHQSEYSYDSDACN